MSLIHLEIEFSEGADVVLKKTWNLRKIKPEVFLDLEVSNFLSGFFSRVYSNFFFGCITIPNVFFVIIHIVTYSSYLQPESKF